MQQVLLIGDPHVTVDALDDCERLIDCIVIAAEQLPKQDNNAIVFLGDLFHNHANVRIEVMDFWRSAFERLRGHQIICLVGNHDRSHDQNIDATALDQYNSYVKVVYGLTQFGQLWLMPWYKDNEKFINDLKDLPFKTLICHQTFDGAQYENGFYAKDGVNQKDVPFSHIISGHIHRPGTIGKVWYPGAPRWRIASDANTDRAIWLLTFDDSGAIANAKSFPTNKFCTEMLHYDEVEGQIINPNPVPKNARLSVSLKGSPDWIKARKPVWEALGAKIATFPNLDQSKTTVRESEGIKTALNKFVNGWQAKHGTSNEVLQKMVGERIYV